MMDLLGWNKRCNLLPYVFLLHNSARLYFVEVLKS